MLRTSPPPTPAWKPALPRQDGPHARLAGQVGDDECVEAHPLSRRLLGQLPVQLARHTHPEVPALPRRAAARGTLPIGGQCGEEGVELFLRNGVGIPLLSLLAEVLRPLAERWDLLHGSR